MVAGPPKPPEGGAGSRIAGAFAAKQPTRKPGTAKRFSGVDIPTLREPLVWIALAKISDALGEVPELFGIFHRRAIL